MIWQRCALEASVVFRGYDDSHTAAATGHCIASRLNLRASSREGVRARFVFYHRQLPRTNPNESLAQTHVSYCTSPNGCQSNQRTAEERAHQPWGSTACAECTQRGVREALRATRCADRRSKGRFLQR